MHAHVCARAHTFKRVKWRDPPSPLPHQQWLSGPQGQIQPKLESIPSLRLINTQGCLCSDPYLRELESDTLDAVGLCAL